MFICVSERVIGAKAKSHDLAEIEILPKHPESANCNIDHAECVFILV